MHPMIIYPVCTVHRVPYLQEVDVRIVLDLPLEVSEFLEDLCESLGLLGQHGGVQEVDRVVGQARGGELLVLVRFVSPDLRKCGSGIKMSNLGWQPDVALWHSHNFSA